MRETTSEKQSDISPSNSTSTLKSSHNVHNTSELIMGEQLISECEKSFKSQPVSHLTFSQYSQMDSEAKNRIHNRV